MTTTTTAYLKLVQEFLEPYLLVDPRNDNHVAELAAAFAAARERTELNGAAEAEAITRLREELKQMTAKWNALEKRLYWLERDWD